MQTGHIRFLYIFPIVLEGCCMGSHEWKRAGLQQDATLRHYRAVEGESFIMPCLESVSGHVTALWSKTGTGGGGGPSLRCGEVFSAEAEHSGTYSCLNGGRQMLLHLQVVAETSVGCFQSDESRLELLDGVGGDIPCPGRNCSNNTHVVWHKGDTPVSKLRRDVSEKDGVLHLFEVKGTYDSAVYFCDRPIMERGVTWTFRRAVQVKVVPHQTKGGPRSIVYPADNSTKEVELGQPLTLVCKAFFPYESKRSGEVRWYVNYGGNRENVTLLDMKASRMTSEITAEYGMVREGFIRSVTPRHLEHTYTCAAWNAVGKLSATISLKQHQVKWPSLVGFPIASLLLVIAVGVILHMKWLELQIIYRSHFQHGTHGREEKRFDVFLSYVWSPTSAVIEGGGTRPPWPGPVSDEKASSIDPLKPVEDEITQTPREVLLRQVLEDQWGYRLCLLERDILPGGAYTNDVVLAIQRSHMLICLLSGDYLRSTDGVFVLESGVQALLQKSASKVLLIWTCTTPASVPQDSPLPPLVHKALKVLPSLDWTSGNPARGSSSFWRSLRKAMPNQRVAGFT